MYSYFKGVFRKELLPERKTDKGWEADENYIIDPIGLAINKAYKDATMRMALSLSKDLSEKEKKILHIKLEAVGDEIIRTAIGNLVKDIPQASRKEAEKIVRQVASELGEDEWYRLKDFSAGNNCRHLLDGKGALSDEYDIWHKNLCESVVKFYNNMYQKLLRETPGQKYNNHQVEFSYGNAQKWVNMTMKYLYIMSLLLQQDEEHSNWCREIISISRYFHIPLDSYILEVISQKSSFSGKKIKAEFNSGQFENKNKTNSWSKIGDYDSYMNYQIKVRDWLASFGQKDLSPIGWEGKQWIKQSARR